MSNLMSVHSSKLHKIAWNGLDLSDGLAKGSYLKFTRNSESSASTQDAGGDSSSTSLSGDISGTVELTLMMQSEANIKLARILAEQESGVIQRGDFRIMAGGTLFLYQPKQAHIQGPPEQEIAELVNDSTQTWTFYSASMPFSELDQVNYSDDVKASITADINVVLNVEI